MCADAPFVKKSFTGIVEDVLKSAKDCGLSDVREGSVLRTLIETFARELAVCYEQLDFVYRCAYLDTATGAALDNVVALLGIERRRAGHIEGTAIFSRSELAADDIYIPAGTLIAGKDAPRLFATVKQAVIAKGERLVSAPIRATEPGVDPGSNEIAAGVLNLMPRPLAGIEQVTNPTSLLLRQTKETDDELRERARTTVRGSNAGTVSAIEQAVRSLGIREVRVVESFDGIPGQIKVVIGDENVQEQLMERVRDAVEEVRPAGLWIETQTAQPLILEIKATLELKPGLSQAQKNDIRSTLEAQLGDHIRAMRIGETVRLSSVISLLTRLEAVVAVKTKDGKDEGILSAYVTKKVNDKTDFTSQDFRCKLNNGDIRVSSSERVVLDQAKPILLTLEPDRLPVYFDVVVTTDPSNADNIERRIAEKLKDLQSEKSVAERNNARAGKTDQVPAELSYEELQNKIKEIPDLKQPDNLRIRITVLHQRNGLVKELQPGDKEELAEDEEPMLRTLKVNPAS
jgi:uncharacterized phage protein gp47/JayE